MTDLTNRIALVTGASRGIGAEAAKALAKAGAHVILVGRTVGGLEEVDDAIQSAGGSATIAPLDLREFALIDQLGATIYERWGNLDILVGNAAMIGILGPICHQNPDQVENIFNTNVIANYRLIRSMNPLLNQSDAGRALFLTDSVAAKNTPYWGSYAASKAALESLILTYAGENNKNPNTKINLLDPGIVATALRAQAFPGEDASTLATPDSIAPHIIRMCSPDYTEHATIYRVD